MNKNGIIVVVALVITRVTKHDTIPKQNSLINNFTGSLFLSLEYTNKHINITGKSATKSNILILLILSLPYSFIL